jgi:hypothetical protein
MKPIIILSINIIFASFVCVFCLFFPDKAKRWIVGDREDLSMWEIRRFDSKWFWIELKIFGYVALLMDLFLIYLLVKHISLM